MQIYTRYKTLRKRWPPRALAQLLLAAVGLGFVGWIVYRTAAPAARREAAGRPAARPAMSTNPAPRGLTAGVRTSGPPPADRAQTLAPATPGPLVQPAPAAPTPFSPRPVANVLEAQVALARRGISSGPIDGALGYQTRAALRAFQRQAGLPVTGALDAATRARLPLEAPAFATYVVSSNDLARLQPVSPTWLGKSLQPRLDFANLLELVAEEHRAHPLLVRRLNPGVDWTNVWPGLSVSVPHVPLPVITSRLAFIRIALRDRILTGHDAQTNLVVHFPCSIGARIEKRPVGRLTVVTAAEHPTYTFNPEIFPESAEARRLNRKLTLPPGPNNPVGVAWIGLDRPGYGIHGTPRPEDVGRTESHGCFRLANWDAALLVRLVRAGLPVYVEP